jgi:hypothetical protein
VLLYPQSAYRYIVAACSALGDIQAHYTVSTELQFVVPLAVDDGAGDGVEQVVHHLLSY